MVDVVNTFMEDPIENTPLWGSFRWAGPGESAMGVINHYQLNNQVINNLFLDTTPGMAQYNTTLNDMAFSTFTRIIMGIDPIEAFDTFVEQWHSLGGATITAEVNEMLGR